jgi:hypothetical protein
MSRYCHAGAKGGVIAPTHSRPRHYKGGTGRRHARAALYPRGKDPLGTNLTGGWVGLRAGLDTEARGKDFSLSLSGIEPQSSICRHYTD